MSRKLLTTALVQLTACCLLAGVASADPAAAQATPPSHEPMADVDAWDAVAQLTPGVNIGNTLENTTHWETGWGNPPITREYVQALADMGFKSVRLPVAWDTYAEDGQITPKQFGRVAEVVNWITDAGMYCVVNIHWDGGWIDSGVKERFPDTHHTFSAEAEKKLESYWNQIARFFAGKNEKLIFEAFNEESNFSNQGSEAEAYAALARANQLFVDTVRATGGNNASRLLLIPGYTTDISKTCRPEFRLPKDKIPGKLLLSVHYYTPWQFVGLNEDADWGKMFLTWGSEEDVKLLNQLFDQLNEFCARRDIPAYLGEFAVCADREMPYRIRWTAAVTAAAVERNMVPVLWDTGGSISRKAPFKAGPEVVEMLRIATSRKGDAQAEASDDAAR